MSLVRRSQPPDRQRRHHPFLSDVAWAFATTCVALLVAWHALGFTELRLHTPVAQSVDASATAFLFASTHENGWHQPILRAGAPFGANPGEVPNSDGLSLMLSYVFGWFTDDPFALLNLFVFASFALCALVAFAVYRRLGLSTMWAAVATLAFTLLPIHFLSDQQPLSTLYIAAALAGWLALDVIWRARGDDKGRPSRGLVVLAALTCGLTGGHFAFFSCLILGAAGVAAAIQLRSPAPLQRAGILAALVLLSTAVQLMPSWWNSWDEATNATLVTPTVQAVEADALKVAPMLLPRAQHTVDALASLRARYDSESAAQANRVDVALGVVGGIGLLLLLALPLLNRVKEALPDDLQRASLLVYAATLFATMGSFGSLFAVFVTPQLHALSRIAPFIAFFAILASIGMLQSLLAKRDAGQRIGVALLVAVLCIVDQAGLGTAATGPTADVRRAAFDQERAFHAAVESELPARSMVLQLPHSSYPPDPAQPLPPGLDPFAGYLHTRSLRWTAGAAPGTIEHRWQRLLGAFPLREQVPALEALGFSAMLLDRRGYPDPAPIDAELAALTLPATLHSADATRSLFPLPNAKAERYRAYAVAPLDGWSEIESSVDQVWIWSTGNASLRLANISGIPRACYVELELASLLVKRTVALRENGHTLAEVVLLPDVPQRLSAYLDERQGERTLELVTDAPAVSPGPQDPRMLAFMLLMRSPPLCR